MNFKIHLIESMWTGGKLIFKLFNSIFDLLTRYPSPTRVVLTCIIIIIIIVVCHTDYIRTCPRDSYCGVCHRWCQYIVSFGWQEKVFLNKGILMKTINFACVCIYIYIYEYSFMFQYTIPSFNIHDSGWRVHEPRVYESVRCFH